MPLQCQCSGYHDMQPATRALAHVHTPVRLSACRQKKRAMTIHSLYIYSRNGSCLYYAEWYRPRNTLADAPGEDAKLMFGLLFSLKLLVNKMTPAPAPDAGSGSGGALFTGSAGEGALSASGGAAASPALPPAGPDQGFFRFACGGAGGGAGGYVLHHLETQTGYRFVLTADAAAGDLRGALWHIYSELFVGHALKNPLYRVGSKIEGAGFAAETDAFVRSLAAFAPANAG